MLYAVHMRAAARLLCARIRQQKTVQLFLFNYYLAAAVSRPNGAAMQCMNTGLEATTLHQVVPNWSPFGDPTRLLGELGTLPDHLGTLPDHLGPYHTIWGPYQTIWGPYQTIWGPY